jgi:hypothetical protein
MVVKVEYICDCGCDNGKCGAKCAYILKYSRIDKNIYTLFHVDRHGNLGNDKKAKITTVAVMENEGLNAMINALVGHQYNPLTLTEEERQEIC